MARQNFANLDIPYDIFVELRDTMDDFLFMWATHLRSVVSLMISNNTLHM